MNEGKGNVEEFFKIFHPHIPSFGELMELHMKLSDLHYNRPNNNMGIINIQAPGSF